MAFLKSEKVKVFPCGGRAKKYDPLARLPTEYNLVSLINRLVDKKSFIVTSHPWGANIYTGATTEDYIININGYLFIIEGDAKAIIESCRKAPPGQGWEGNYIIAVISPQEYSNSQGDIYTQLGPLEPSTQDPLIPVKVKIDIPDETYLNNNYDEYDSVKSIYKRKGFTHFYIKRDTDNFYYRCNSQGNFICNFKNDGFLDDADEKFKGISFICSSTHSIGDIPESHQLTLFEKVNDSCWIEYEDSKIKFHTDGKNRSVKIDDGVI